MSMNAASADISTAKTSLEQDEPRFEHLNQKQLAWQDCAASLRNWRVWFMLAYQDIKLRYRRSVLGPFWITLSMAITVYSMGYLYSHLFHIELRDYFPYLVAGMLAWSLISTVLTDLVDTYTQAEYTLKQIKLPYTLYIHRVIMRNILIFAHNLLVLIPVYLFFNHSIHFGWQMLLIVPGFLLFYANAVSFGLILAMIGARYRDISQIIKSLIQVIFFITPVMWRADVLPPAKQFIAYLNPCFAMLELIRGPLLGYVPNLLCFVLTGVLTIIGLVSASLFFTSRRARIIYWV